VVKSATFGVKWASDESFCPSTLPYHISSSIIVDLLAYSEYDGLEREPLAIT